MLGSQRHGAAVGDDNLKVYSEELDRSSLFLLGVPSVVHCKRP